MCVCVCVPCVQATVHLWKSENLLARSLLSPCVTQEPELESSDLCANEPSQQPCFLFFNSLGFLLKSTWSTVRVKAREYYCVLSVGRLRRIHPIPHPQWLRDGRGTQFQLTDKDEILLKGVACDISILGLVLV